MKQDIRLAAILERGGRVFLVRPERDSAWELPGGPLPLENDDIDAEMDSLLQRLGVTAPAIEEDFLATHYFPVDGGQVVYNVYAATEWTGDPLVAPGTGSGWFEPVEFEAMHMDERARGALLEAFGLREPVDRAAEILTAMMESPSDRPATQVASNPSRRAAGLDVLRTLRGGGVDPAEAAAAMARTQPEISGDVIDFALGEVWTDPALDRKTRSLQVVAMLAALGRTGAPLTSHINGALNHGASPEQVVQTLRMVAVYAGFPAALEAWPAMEQVFQQRGITRPGKPQ